MHWILQKGPFDENLDKFVYEISRLGHTYTIFSKDDDKNNLIRTENSYNYCSTKTYDEHNNLIKSEDNNTNIKSKVKIISSNTLMSSKTVIWELKVKK